MSRLVLPCPRYTHGELRFQCCARILKVLVCSLSAPLLHISVNYTFNIIRQSMLS